MHFPFLFTCPTQNCRQAAVYLDSAGRSIVEIGEEYASWQLQTMLAVGSSLSSWAVDRCRRKPSASGLGKMPGQFVLMVSFYWHRLPLGNRPPQLLPVLHRPNRLPSVANIRRPSATDQNRHPANCVCPNRIQSGSSCVSRLRPLYMSIVHDITRALKKYSIMKYYLSYARFPNPKEYIPGVRFPSPKEYGFCCG